MITESPGVGAEAFLNLTGAGANSAVQRDSCLGRLILGRESRGQLLASFHFLSALSAQLHPLTGTSCTPSSLLDPGQAGGKMGMLLVFSN